VDLFHQSVIFLFVDILFSFSLMIPLLHMGYGLLQFRRLATWHVAQSWLINTPVWLLYKPLTK